MGESWTAKSIFSLSHGHHCIMSWCTSCILTHCDSKSSLALCLSCGLISKSCNLGIFHDPPLCSLHCFTLMAAKTYFDIFCLCCFRFKFFKLFRQLRTDLVRLFHLHWKAQNLESRKFVQRDQKMSSRN